MKVDGAVKRSEESDGGIKKYKKTRDQNGMKRILEGVKES